MSYYSQQQQQPYSGAPPTGAPLSSSSAAAAQNLKFYPSSYAPSASASISGVSGRATPSSSSYGGGGYRASSAAGYGYGSHAHANSSSAAGVSGRMGAEQGGLRTGWLAAFSTEGYDGEPSLLEELDVNFAHVQAKVGECCCCSCCGCGTHTSNYHPLLDLGRA
jgi:hypothetical protein